MIGEARTALVGLLEDAGFRAYDYVPPNITPPVAVIFPTADWIQPGENYGEYRIGFNVRIFAQALTNEQVTIAIDSYVESLIEYVDAAPGFYMSGIGMPEQFAENNSSFLGVEAIVYQITRQ
jgi:hypothetical protein